MTAVVAVDASKAVVREERSVGSDQFWWVISGEQKAETRYLTKSLIEAESVTLLEYSNLANHC